MTGRGLDLVMSMTSPGIVITKQDKRMMHCGKTLEMLLLLTLGPLKTLEMLLLLALGPLKTLEMVLLLAMRRLKGEQLYFLTQNTMDVLVGS